MVYLLIFVSNKVYFILFNMRFCDGWLLELDLRDCFAFVLRKQGRNLVDCQEML